MDLIKRYLKEIKDIPLLTSKQEIDLANKMQYHGMRPFDNEPAPKPGILSALMG